MNHRDQAQSAYGPEAITPAGLLSSCTSIEHTLKALTDTIRGLESKLTPVMRPMPEVPGGSNKSAPPASSSAFRDRLDAIRNDLSICKEHLTMILESLDL